LYVLPFVANNIVCFRLRDDLWLDDLAFEDFGAYLQKHFQVDISASQWDSLLTIGNVLELLPGYSKERTFVKPKRISDDLLKKMFPPVIDRFKEKRQLAPNAIPMISFYHAGGAVANLRLFSKQLDKVTGSIAVNPIWVELPGRGVRIREDLQVDCRKSATDIAHGIIQGPLQGNVKKPFFVFAHSNGTLHGFEVIRLLQRMGCVPRAFVALSRQAPQIPMDGPNDNLVHNVSDGDFVAKMAKEYGQKELLKLWDESPEIVLKTLHISRNDMQNLQDYRFDGWQSDEPNKIECPIIAAVGKQDRKSNNEKSVGAWDQLTSSEFHFKLFNGGHFFYSEEAASFLAWMWPLVEQYLH